MIRTSLDFVGAAVDLGVNEPQHSIYSANVAPKEDKAFGPKSGHFFAMAIPVLSAYPSTLMTMGLWLGIFMPMLPFFKFVLAQRVLLALMVYPCCSPDCGVTDPAILSKTAGLAYSPAPGRLWPWPSYVCTSPHAHLER